MLYILIIVLPAKTVLMALSTSTAPSDQNAVDNY